MFFPTEIVEKINTMSPLTEEEKTQHAKIYCIYSPNSSVQSHTSIAHGGFTATLIDNMMGTLSGIVSDYKPSATAYLNINYKKPIFTGKEYLMVCSVNKMEGKKNFMKIEIFNEKMEKCTEAEALFIQVDWKGQLVSHLLGNSKPKADK